MTWNSAGRNDAFWAQYWITDRAGNTTIKYAILRIDNTGPTILRVGYPRVDGHVQGQSALTAAVVDLTSVDRVEWWVDGALLHTSRTTPYTLNWDTGKTNGTATLEIRAYDGFGSSSTLKQSVIVDNMAPTITGVAPANRTLVRGHFRTSVKATDHNGLGMATLWTNDGDNATYEVAKPPFSQLVWSGDRDGPQKLEWQVTDRVGNSATVVRTVIVDNTRPGTKITKAPRNGAKVKGTVTITASASDRNGISRVELLINGKVVATDAKASYKFSVKVRKYGKKLRVRLRAYDKAGNTTTTATRTWHR